jgi:hypothetical protein
MPWEWSSTNWARLNGNPARDGDPASSPAAVQADNEALVVFWRGTDNALWHRWQDPDSEWRQPPLSLGGELTSGPAAVRAENKRLVAFWRGTDNALWHRWQNLDFNWSEPMSLGDPLTSGPAAVLAANKRLVVFWRGADNALWHRWQDLDFGWSQAPLSLAEGLAGGPAAVLAANERLVVFWRGTDNALWHRRQDLDFGWSQAPESLADGLTSDPSAALRENRLSVFWRGTDNALWHRWQDPFASDEWVPAPISLGAMLTSGPAAITTVKGSLAAFVRGADNGLHHRGQNWVSPPVPGSPYFLPMRAETATTPYEGSIFRGLFPGDAKVAGIRLEGSGSAQLANAVLTHVGHLQANTLVVPNQTTHVFDGQPLEGLWRADVRGSGLTLTNVSLRFDWE